MKKPRKSKSRSKAKRQHIPVAPRRPQAVASPADVSFGDLIASVQATARGHVVTAGRACADAAAFGLSSARSGLAKISAVSRATVPEDGFGAWARRARQSAALALPYSADDRDVFALVFLPFLLFASAMVISQTLRRAPEFPGTVAQSPEETAASRRVELRRMIAALPRQSLEPVGEPRLVPVRPGRALRDSAPSRQALAPAVPSLAEVGEAAAPGEHTIVQAQPQRDVVRTEITPHDAATAIALGVPLLSPPLVGLDEAAPARAPITALTHSGPTVAADHAAPPALLANPSTAVAMLDLGAPFELPGFDADSDPATKGICDVATAALATASHSAAVAAQTLAPTPDSFGLELAQAALRQIDGFVIYDDTYRTIRYPMGDVPPLFGVCTDVIVRAYRALGFDLQQLVHEARSGSGDTNIDHRRTEVLRRFFATYGESLAVTSFAEDYQPGDIVTYNRPQNRHSRSHIAMVSAIVAPSGRPMIIHNRGWGPELEDGLFVDEITGHYRYYGGLVKHDTQKAELKPAASGAPAGGRGGKLNGLAKPVAYAPASSADVTAAATGSN